MRQSADSTRHPAPQSVWAWDSMTAICLKPGLLGAQNHLKQVEILSLPSFSAYLEKSPIIWFLLTIAKCYYESNFDGT